MITIHLPQEVLDECIVLSPKLREHLIKSITTEHTDLHAELLAMMLSCRDSDLISTNGINKIGFIKRIREHAEKRLAEYVRRFPGILKTTVVSDGRMSLVDAKHLSEHYINMFS